MNPEDNNPYHTEWIERYLSGELQGEELQSFNRRLQTDSTFGQEVALQRTIVEQTRQVGREELRAQLKDMHRQTGFVPKKTMFTPFHYAMAAAVALLLAVSLVIYFYLNQSELRQGTIAEGNTPASQGQLTYIPFRSSGATPDMGFTGVQPDSTIAIVVYPAASQTPAYRFDDTLRLFGSFPVGRLRLQYDPAAEQYTLQQDSLVYPLQRYRPVQPLQAKK